MRWQVGVVMLAGGCAGGPAVDDAKCRYVRHDGMCEATVTLDPRENESPDEATTLEIRWQWQGDAVSDVPERVTRTQLPAREARSLAEAIDEMERSPCVVEQAIEPAECVGIARIVAVEAEP